MAFNITEEQTTTHQVPPDERTHHHLYSHKRDPVSDPASNLKDIQRTEEMIELHNEIATTKIQTMENTTGKEKDGGKLSIQKDLKDVTDIKNGKN